MIILSSSHLTNTFRIQLVQTESHQIDNISNGTILNIGLIPKARAQTEIKSATTTDLRITFIFYLMRFGEQF